LTVRRTGEPTVSPEEADYFRGIEERFCALRGRAMLLSPKDWNLIASWWSEKIPRSLILESLEEVFVGRRRRGEESRDVNSLSYVKGEVLRRWRLHREMTAPRRAEGEETARLREDLRRHLGRLSRSLTQAASRVRESGREILARTALEAGADLRALRKSARRTDWDPLQAEKVLESLDGEILAAAASSLDQPQRLRLEQEAEIVLRRRRSDMERQAYGESLAAVRSRLLRREFGLPRLSLLGED
jgi:hypothetical protein